MSKTTAEAAQTGQRSSNGTNMSVNWSGLMAMGVISIVPMIIAFVLLEPFLVSGMAAGSVVG
jgi:ABC-type glycerol-3-phosphate transport system permease component